MVKTNVFVLAIRFQGVFKTSSWPLAKISSRRFQDVLQQRLQDVLKASSRHLQDALPKRLQGVFKTSSIHLAKTSSRHLQDAFKTYHQVKLFLLTRLRELFNTFLRCSFPKTYFSQSNTTSEKFMVSYKTCKRDENFPSFSFSL